MGYKTTISGLSLADSSIPRSDIIAMPTTRGLKARFNLQNVTTTLSGGVYTVDSLIDINGSGRTFSKGDVLGAAILPDEINGRDAMAAGVNYTALASARDLLRAVTTATMFFVVKPAAQPLSGSTTSNPARLFLVTNIDASATRLRLELPKAPTANKYVVVGSRQDNEGNSTFTCTDDATTDWQVIVVDVSYLNNTASVYRNNTQIGYAENWMTSSGGPTSNTAASLIYLFGLTASTSWGGLFADWSTFTTPMTSSAREDTVDYLKELYGIS